MAEEPQSLQNHGRTDPMFHFFLMPMGLVFLILAIIEAVRAPGWVAYVHIIAVVWLMLAILKIRLYALKVQDRVIRAEERLRLQSLLSPALQPRIAELSIDQLIGLRFASDAEVPGLVEKTLGGNWDRKQIKSAIQNWRADDWRV
jgi:hypothetical protein